MWALFNAVGNFLYAASAWADCLEPTIPKMLSHDVANEVEMLQASDYG
jgi:hypothetical protein